MREKVREKGDLRRVLEELGKSGKRVVFTNG